MEFHSFSLPRKLGVATPPILVALAATLSIFGVGAGLTFYPFLLISAVGVTILGVSAIVAWVSAKSFLLSGSVNLLFLGLAVLVFGSMSILGGLVSQISSAAGNLVYLLGLLAAGILHLTSGVLTYVGSPQQKGKLRAKAGVAYSVAVLFMVVFSVLAIELAVPQIGTAVTKIVVACTASLLLAAGFLFSRVYSRSHSSVLFWYSLGLATTAFAFVALLFAQNTGDLGNWTSIGGVLLGSFYFLISVFAAPQTFEASMTPKPIR
jgi:hypothetical protein